MRYWKGISPQAIVDRNPTILDIRRALSNRSPVIALVDSCYTSKARGARNPPHLPHWIVIRGYDDEQFYINDSTHESGLETGKTVMKGRLLEKAMDTYSRFGWPSALVIVGSRKANWFHTHIVQACRIDQLKSVETLLSDRPVRTQGQILNF